MQPSVLSVNLGRARPNPYKPARSTGIGKVPTTDPVAVRAPGPDPGGSGSGLAGDFIGDLRHHGGEDQAVYAFAREDLDHWQAEFDQDLPNGFFGENLTTTGVDPNAAELGERWEVGEQVRLRVTVPRIPCSTFRGWVGRRGWLRRFTQAGRPGAYLAVERPGEIRAGDPITVMHRPGHGVTIAAAFAGLTDDPASLPDLAAAEPYLTDELRALVERARTGPNRA